MAIEIQQEKKSNPFVWIIILIIIVGGGIWGVKTFLKPGEIIPKPLLKDVLPSETSEEVFNADLQINKVIDNSVFKTLAPHISWPITGPSLGRPNPFQPL